MPENQSIAITVGRLGAPLEELARTACRPGVEQLHHDSKASVVKALAAIEEAIVKVNDELEKAAIQSEKNNLFGTNSPNAALKLM